MSDNPGTLYVVATPIGNLEDLSPRARRVLDTVTHFGINTTLFALHEHNEREASEALLQPLMKGASVALVSDAGTPLISDPGYRLVRVATEAGIVVSPIPGPSAAIAALSIAGLPTDRFLFLGFLPSKATARRSALQGLRREHTTMVLFESVHRCGELLRDIADVFGRDRPVVVARELTKKHEAIYRGSASVLADSWDRGEIVAKGEFVLCVGGAPADSSDGGAAERLLELLLAELPLKTAVRVTSEFSGEAKNLLYARALSLRSGESEDDA